MNINILGCGEMAWSMVMLGNDIDLTGVPKNISVKQKNNNICSDPISANPTIIIIIIIIIIVIITIMIMFIIITIIIIIIISIIIISRIVIIIIVITIIIIITFVPFRAPHAPAVGGRLEGRLAGDGGGR